MSFLKQYANEGFIIFYGGCGSAEWKVMGSQCHPMKLSAGGKDDKDGNVTTLTFEQEMLNSDRVMFYDGTVNAGAPVVVADLETIALAKASGLIYKLSENNAAADVGFASSDLDGDTFITLIGGGGSTPALLKNTPAGSIAILTKQATNWSALAGATITLQVMKADKTYLVEVART